MLNSSIISYHMIAFLSLLACNMSVGVPMTAGVRYASFDGDADRIVYYYFDNGETRCCSFNAVCKEITANFVAYSILLLLYINALTYL